jgi:hypothetical protein
MIWRALGPIVTASQVIPVLMLALVIESRVFAAALRSPLPPPRRSWGPTLDRVDPYFPHVMVGLVVALMCIGELAALGTVGGADYRSADPFGTYFVLGFGAAAVATLPFWNAPATT